MAHDSQRKGNDCERLRAELLISGLTDWVSLAEVQQIVSQLADGASERQELILRTIRSLLDDRLMQIGDLPGADDPFSAGEPIEVAMARLHDRFVGHYAEPASWDYSIWLGLTEAGVPIATALRANQRA